MFLRKDGVEYSFTSPNAAAEWLIANKYVKSNNLRCVRNYLTNNYLKNRTYYGYEIDYESKI